MKSGFIAILGRPNVGKSSLMNALIGEKVSIVSPKAQTTRDKVKGILTTKEYQMVFIDTPGFHLPKTKLGEYMNMCVNTSAVDADAVVIVLDLTKKPIAPDYDFIEKYLKKSSPVYLVLNKTDLVPYDKIYPLLSTFSPYTQKTDDRAAIKEIIPLSARKGKNVDVLLKYLVSELKEDVIYYPEDDLTDRDERFMITEIVREKTLYMLGDEIPHGIGVYIQDMKYDKKGTAHIKIDIIAEKDSHKPIIIGKEGEMLKKIAESSRNDIEKLLDCKVFTEFFVKIRKDWRNKQSIMSDIGYDLKGSGK